ncbi:MAG: 4Fe-4S binding protein [Candidatus Omnitrophica bacterium]|nr:4Fe-4S binding protein [Candidatus Omnitrophota bacterium]
MPWVNEEECIGCGICVENCPVEAISLSIGQAKLGDGKAKINMNKCTRCGTCQSVCPQEAVRPDSEKIPEFKK